MSTTPQPRPADPEPLVHQAIEWCAQQGIPVAVEGDPNVHCLSRYMPKWERFNEERPVSVLGACILRYQPQTADLDVAEWMAVGQTRRWVEAFAVGCAGFVKPADWERSPCSRLMTHGYLLGLSIRTAATMDVCRMHAVKFARGEVCPRCLEDDAPDTDRDPNAGRH